MEWSGNEKQVYRSPRIRLNQIGVVQSPRQLLGATSLGRLQGVLYIRKPCPRGDLAVVPPVRGVSGIRFAPSSTRICPDREVAPGRGPPAGLGNFVLEFQGGILAQGICLMDCFDSIVSSYFSHVSKCAKHKVEVILLLKS